VEIFISHKSLFSSHSKVLLAVADEWLAEALLHHTRFTSSNGLLSLSQYNLVLKLAQPDTTQISRFTSCGFMSCLVLKLAQPFRRKYKISRIACYLFHSTSLSSDYHNPLGDNTNFKVYLRWLSQYILVIRLAQPFKRRYRFQGLPPMAYLAQYVLVLGLAQLFRRQ
jgi:hypothetical protein